MALYTSNTAAFTTLPAQYLFRLYHRPITATRTDTLELGPEYNEDYELEPRSGFELNFNQYLMTIPPTSEEIIDAANRLAYAESLLYVDDEIDFIAVWMVGASQPISQRSPMVVLHPYQSNQYQEIDIPRLNPIAPYQAPLKPFGSTRYAWTLGNIYSTWRGFASYDLTTFDSDTEYFDPFLALNIARQCERGAARQYMFKGCVRADDWYVKKNGTYILNPSGSLYLMRFPYYFATLETMSATHSGWTLNTDGSIDNSSIAVTFRTANAVTNLAEARRMFMLNYGLAATIEELWHNTAKEVSWLLYTIDRQGYMEVLTVENEGSPFPPVSFGAIRYSEMMKVCTRLMEFVNRAAVANGAESLLLHWPDATDAERAAYWHDLAYTTNPYATVRQQYAQSSETNNTEVLTALADIVGSVMEYLFDFHKASKELPFDPVYGNYASSYLLSIDSAKVYNDFTTKFVTLQANLHAAFNLMFTWQFTHRPERKTRAPGAGHKLRTAPIPEFPYPSSDAQYFDNTSGRQAPILTQRASWDYPVFAPYRIWGVEEVPANDSAAVLAARADVYAAAQAVIAAAEESERALARVTRAAIRSAQIAALEADIASGGGVNPLDPYDWRNWSRKDYWLTPVKVEDVPRFVLIATDTPSLIEAGASALQFSPKIQKAIHRLEPTIMLVKEIAYPHLFLRKRLKNLEYLSLTKDAVVGTYQNYTNSGKNAVIERVYNSVAGAPPAYVDREMFPQTRPDTSANPFQTAAPSTGGGTSGGAGAGDTWEEEA